MKYHEIKIFLDNYKSKLFNLCKTPNYIDYINNIIYNFLNFDFDERVIYMFSFENNINITVNKESPVTFNSVKHEIIFPVHIKIKEIMSVDDLNNITFFCILTSHGRILKNYSENIEYVENNISEKINILANKFYNSSVLFDLSTDNISFYTDEIDNITVNSIIFLNNNILISDDLLCLIKNSKCVNIECFLIFFKKYEILLKKKDNEKKKIEKHIIALKIFVSVMISFNFYNIMANIINFAYQNHLW